MKKIIILILLSNPLFTFSQESLWNSNIKSVFGEVGYGSLKWSGALGFRFWNLGISMGLAGFSASKPRYIYPSKDYPLPKQYEYEEYKFTYILVTTELYYFWEIFDDFIITPSLGFYVQQDSVLARSLRDNDYGLLYYLGKTENKTGITFGLGIDYYYSDDMVVGLGYNYRRGLFARIAYYWF